MKNNIQIQPLLLRIGILFLIFQQLFFFYSCGTGNEFDSKKFELVLFLQLVYPGMCSRSGALRFGPDSDSCISNKVSEGLIYDADTGEKIITAEILFSDQIALECRYYHSTNWLSAYDKSWYFLDRDNPPAGHTVEKIFSHTYYYDTSNNIAGVVPFTTYNQGDRLVCLSSKTSSPAYQILKIK